MIDRQPPSRDSNPFSTCWTDHRLNGYVELASVSVDEVALQLEAYDWRGQIVGPHGVGKSALLNELSRRFSGSSLRFIEGFERIPGWKQRLQITAWRILRQAVVVTTHKRIPGLPVLVELGVNRETMRALFARLTHEALTPVCQADADEAFDSSCGDLRTTWLQLHLIHEERTRGVGRRTVRIAHS